PVTPASPKPAPPKPAPVAAVPPIVVDQRIIAAPAEAVPLPPPAPRRSLGVWLAAFMEERNILWGELTGGLLMGGCSVALVLSLWKTLEQIPLFPFIILAAITSLLFAIGRYTLHHWKLEATSRGLLVIALLLVPLNYLVLAGLSPKATGSPLGLGIKTAGIPLFSRFVRLGARGPFPAGAIPQGLLRGFRVVDGGGVGHLHLSTRGAAIAQTRHRSGKRAACANPCTCRAARRDDWPDVAPEVAGIRSRSSIAGFGLHRLSHLPAGIDVWLQHS